MNVSGRVVINHFGGPCLRAEHGSQGGSVQLVAGRFGPGGVALHDYSEALFLDHADPWFHKICRRYLTLSNRLDTFQHGARVDSIDVAFLDKPFQHL